jgi:hypothetical protein
MTELASEAPVAPEPGPARPPERRWLTVCWAILPPFAVFAASWLQLFLNARAHGRAFTPDLFIHYDAFLYQSIAQKGYDFYPCQGYHIANDFRGAQFCGNAGWLPLYPWMLRLVHLGVSNWALCAVLVSGAAFFGCLLLLWNEFLKRDAGWRPLVLLTFAGFFPGQTWYASGYPVSTFLLLVLLAFAFLGRRRFLFGGLAGGLAAITYSTGFLLFFVFGFWLLITERGKSWRSQLRTQLAVPGLVALGFASFLGLHAVRLHAWNAFFKVQAKYGHGLHNPFVTFAQKTQPLWKAQFWLDYGRFPAQTVFVALLVVGVCVTLWRQRQLGISPIELLALIYTLTFWFVPLVIGQGVTIYRAESLLLPMTLLLRRWGVWVQLGCVVIAVALAIQFPESFFVNFMP